MPKIIKNIEADILAAAKDELLKNGYGGLAIRQVAARCRIATGTIYNYYSSKDMLVAHVMLEDWHKALTKMKAACSSAATIKAGFHGIFEALSEFRQDYNGIWAEYTFTGMGLSAYRSRHEMLITQLTGLIHELLERMGAHESRYLEEFLASDILTAATDEKPFEQFSVVLDRIFKEETK